MFKLEADARYSNRAAVGGCSFCPGRLETDAADPIVEVTLPGLTKLRLCPEHISPFVEVLHDIEFQLEKARIEIEKDAGLWDGAEP